MADLSAVADSGSGHMLGHVLGNGQAVSMANCHVSSMSVYVEVFSFYLVSGAIIAVYLHLCTLDTAWITDRQDISEPLWHNRVSPLTEQTTALHHQIALTMTVLFLSDSPFYFNHI